MEKKGFRFLLISLFLSCLVLHCCALTRTRTEVLGNFHKAMFKAKSDNDKSHYHSTIDFHETETLNQDGLKEKDRIIGLPGQPKGDVGFGQYGGYVTVNATVGRAFYYYFVEAVNGSQNLPLLLWLNGGPGCSSLGYGAFLELGPFRPQSDGKTLFNNPFSWNLAANVLFLESPAGVGFSYSNTTSDYTNNGDNLTAIDNYGFLVNWLERFPEYKNRDFYIGGESYAGHYVPQLADTVLYHNKMSKGDIINLKGILIGNAELNDETDYLGMFDYWTTHGIVSYETNRGIHENCHFLPDKPDSEACNNSAIEANTMMSYIDIYNIYAPLCFQKSVTPQPKQASIYDYDPCSEYYITAYMNSPSVQEALHANVTKVSFDWQPCSDTVFNSWKDRPSTIIPLLQEFLANGLRVWIYSGDTDGRVPVTSTQYTLDALKLPITSPWRPWFYLKEVGGYTQGYGTNLTFATVRGAGHDVPSYQPGRALTLVSSFLTGKTLPEIQ